MSQKFLFLNQSQVLFCLKFQHILVITLYSDSNISIEFDKDASVLTSQSDLDNWEKCKRGEIACFSDFSCN